MATFHLTDPSGATYEIEAPDEGAAIQALQQATRPQASSDAGDAADAARQGNVPSGTPQPDSGPQDGSALGAAASAARALRMGLPFGDRIVAAEKTYLPQWMGGNRQSYSDNLAAERGADQSLAAAHPFLTGTGQAIGGLALPVSAAGAASKATSLFGKAMLGGATGLGLGAIQGISDAPDWTNGADTLKHAAIGAGTGGFIGMGLPLLARGIGAAWTAGANKLAGGVDGVSSGAAAHLLPALAADGLANVQSQVGRLGDQAMLADVGLALLGKAQGASLNSDGARSIMVNALLDRQQGANGRIGADIDAALGPARDPQMVTNDILAQRTAQDQQNYGRAFQGNPRVDTSALAAALDQHIADATGMEKKALTGLKSEFMVPNPEAGKPVGLADTFDAAPTASAAPSMPATPQKPNAQTLVNFLQRNGGVQDPGGELRAADFNRFPGLIRPTGQPIDYAREEAAQAGYFGHDTETATANTTVSDLIDAILSHPKYTARDQEALDAYEAAMRSADEGRRAHQDASSAIAGDLLRNGFRPNEIDPGLLDQAAHIHLNEDVPIENAYEAATMRGHDTAPSAAFPGDMPTQQPPAMIPQDRGLLLHKIKGDLDNVIQYDAPGLGVPAGAVSRQQGALKQMRGQLNAALEAQIPGYADANAASSELARQADAVKLGTALLDSGKTAMTPERLAQEWGAMSPGEQAAARAGTRGEIDRLLDTRANDLVAGKNVIKGEGDWNRARLGTIFGAEPTNQVIGAIDREGRFANTYNKVVENSQTAQRQAAAKAMKPEPSSETPLFNPNMTLTGLGATLAKKGGNAVLGAMRADPTKSYGEVARILSATGGERDNYIKALADALDRRQGNAATGALIGDRAALAAAILANGADRERQLLGR